MKPTERHKQQSSTPLSNDKVALVTEAVAESARRHRNAQNGAARTPLT